MVSLQHNDRSKNVFTNVLVESVEIGSRVRLITVDNQTLPSGLFISCSRKERLKFPVGSTFRLDCRLITPTDRKPFLLLVRSQPLSQYKLFSSFLFRAPS